MTSGKDIAKATAILATLALLIMAPSLLFGPVPIDSAVYNHVWVGQFGEALARGEAYPRWLPGSFEGLGAPTFYFYPPLAFFAAGGLHAAGLSVGQAINVTALVVLIGSGLAMYGWLRFRGGRALPGAALFMAAPYHLIDFYKRAALAEFSAFLWLPLIALAIEAWPRRWAAPLLAVSFAGLVGTHLPTAVLAGLFLIAPMVVRSAWRVCDARRIAAYAGAGAAGLALASPYLYPALTLQKHIAAELLWTPFFQPNSWAPLGHPDVIPAIVRWPAPVAALSALLAGTALWRSRGSAAAPELRFWGWLAIAAAALGLALIPGFWLLPVLEKVQFPWRLFVVMEFAAVTAVALAPPLPRRALQVAGLLAVACYLRLAVLCVNAAMNYALPSDVNQTLPDAPEYVPTGVGGDIIADPRNPDIAGLRGPEATGPVAGFGAGADGTMTVFVGAPGRVVLRRFSFPAWSVERNGADIPTLAQGPGRLVAFDATPGTYELTRRMLPEERQGYWLGLLGVALTLGLFAAAPSSGRRRERKTPSASR